MSESGVRALQFGIAMLLAAVVVGTLTLLLAGWDGRIWIRKVTTTVQVVVRPPGPRAQARPQPPPRRPTPPPVREPPETQPVAEGADPAAAAQGLPV